MCIIVAKYFKGLGWILAKNRDQDYIPDVTFRDKIDKKVGEILVMYDHDIFYQEGMNHDGLAIISTSLTPTLIDEINKQDGDHIWSALHMKQKDAANYLIKQKMTGFIFLATPETLILIEAARMNGGIGEYRAKLRYIPKNETVIRTNHGVDLPWAGFQYGVSEHQDFRRQSSESRMEIGNRIIQNVKTPIDMLNALASKITDNLQMNIFRVENKPRQMRTIFQWALIPSKGIAVIRPISTKLRMKVSYEKIRVEILDNAILKEIYGKRLRHFSYFKSSNGGKEIKTIIKEKMLYFQEYIEQNS